MQVIDFPLRGDFITLDNLLKATGLAGSRSADKLQALADRLTAEHGSKVWVMPADLAQPGAPAALAAQLRRKHIAVDVLVNNAGVLEHGAFAAIPAGRNQALIDLNVSALT